MSSAPLEPREGQPTDRPVLGAVLGAGDLLGKAVGQDVWRLQEGELGAVLEGLEAVRRDTERLLVAVVGEALARGAHNSQGFSSGVDYLRHHTPSLEPVEAHQLVTVAAACTQARHAPVAAAVASGAVSVRRAAAVLRAMEQVRPFVDADQYLADQEIVLPVAVGGTEKDLRAVVRHLVECARPQHDSDAFEDAQRRARGLSVRPGPGNLTDFTWRLDPEGAAFVHAAIDPLAKPQPDGDGPDPRSPAQRRSDALMEVLHRGMGSPGAAPTTARAKVLVTFSYDQLTDQVSGLGRTLTGHQLTPRTIRRIACEADLIPAVLGADGEVLDLGRRTRLATPAQRLALWLEERGCTYQGCSMPAQWCDAHHATWWSRGGPTDQHNLHLLCARHHTRVHDLDLRPVVQPHATSRFAGGTPTLRWQPDNP